MTTAAYLSHQAATNPSGRASLHNTRETAQYVADMLLELRAMSKSEGFGTLQGLLEIAYYEAFSAAHKVDLPEGEMEHLEKLGLDALKA